MVGSAGTKAFDNCPQAKAERSEIGSRPVIVAVIQQSRNGEWACQSHRGWARQGVK